MLITEAVRHQAQLTVTAEPLGRCRRNRTVKMTAMSAPSTQRRPAFMSGLKHFYLFLMVVAVAWRHSAPGPQTMTLQPGALVCLRTRPDATFQVVNVNDSSDCVWVRRFPLGHRRLPTFGVQASQVQPVSSEFRP